MTDQMSAEEFQTRYCGGNGSRNGARTHKYRAQRTEYDGVLYDSKAEAERAALLDMLVRTGDVLFWSGQPRFELHNVDGVLRFTGPRPRRSGQAVTTYIADFLVVSRGMEIVVEDVKGYGTPTWRKNLRLWREFGPYPLRVVRKAGNGWRSETVAPGLPIRRSF